MKKLIVLFGLLMASAANAATCVEEITEFVQAAEKKDLKAANYSMLDQVTVVYEMSSLDGSYTEGFMLTLHTLKEDDVEAKILKKGQCNHEQQIFNFYILSTDRAVQAESKSGSDGASGS
jgi:hypothetical protein